MATSYIIHALLHYAALQVVLFLTDVFFLSQCFIDSRFSQRPKTSPGSVDCRHDA
jgi:hypothetical protein